MSEPTRQHTDEAGMLWWPYRRYELTSKLSPQQLKEKIDWADWSEAEYTITYAEKYISIKESANFKFGAYSKSFKPEATLVKVAVAEGSGFRVVIKTRTAQLLLLFLVILLIIAGVAFSKRYQLSLGNYKDTLIACVGVLVLGYLLPVVNFNADLSKLKLFIDELLEIDQQN